MEDERPKAQNPASPPARTPAPAARPAGPGGPAAGTGAPPAPPPRPPAPTLPAVEPSPATKALADAVKERFADAAVEITPWGEAQVRVPREKLLEVCRFLKEQGLDYLSSETVIDYVKEGRFEFDLRLFGLASRAKAVVKADLDREGAVVPTLTGLWPTANWHEREVWDMFGVKFEGHPDLRRILLSESFQGFPLRKDFVDARKPRPRLVRNRR